MGGAPLHRSLPGIGPSIRAERCHIKDAAGSVSAGSVGGGGRVAATMSVGRASAPLGHDHPLSLIETTCTSPSK